MLSRTYLSGFCTYLWLLVFAGFGGGGHRGGRKGKVDLSIIHKLVQDCKIPVVCDRICILHQSHTSITASPKLDFEVLHDCPNFHDCSRMCCYCKILDGELIFGHCLLFGHDVLWFVIELSLKRLEL